MAWKPEVRNFDKIQFETLRKSVDDKFNAVHDELSDCFYNKKPFRSYGILTKEQFDKLHGLIFQSYNVTFHAENLKQKKEDQILEDKYNNVYDKEGVLAGKKSDISQIAINLLKIEGYELAI